MKPANGRRRNRRSWRPDLVRRLVLALVVAAATPLAGQALVQGTVLDETTAPVAQATVRLAGTGAVTTTDDAGQFRFGRVVAGTYRLEIRKVGMISQDVSITIGSETSVLDPPVIILRFIRTRLDELIVEGEASEWSREGLRQFQEARRTGRGYFLTSGDIEGLDAFQVSDIFRRVPGAILERQAGGTAVRFSRTGETCEPRVTVDGIVSTNPDVDFVVGGPEELAGVWVDPGRCRIALWRKALYQEDTSSFQIGLRWGALRTRNPDESGSLSAVMMLPLPQGLQFYPGVGLATRASDISWEAQLALVGSPWVDFWYLGGGVHVEKGRGDRILAQEPATTRARPLLINGLRARLGPFRPFAEILLFDVHSSSSVEARFEFGIRWTSRSARTRD